MGKCAQCGNDLGDLEIIVLGPVCGKCCRANHRRMAGHGAATRKQRKQRKAKGAT